MRAIFVIGIIVIAGFILLGVLWNSSLNTHKEAERIKAKEEEAAGLKQKVDKLSESLKERDIKHEKAQVDVNELKTRLQQVLENESVISDTRQKELVLEATIKKLIEDYRQITKLSESIKELEKELEERKSDIDKLLTDKEFLARQNSERERIINNLNEQTGKLEKRIKELEESLARLASPELPPVQYVEWNDKTTIELPKNKIIVVENTDDPFIIANSEYPRIENILDSFNIGYTLVNKVDFNNDKYSLAGKWAVLFNSETRNNNAVFSEKTIDKIRKFTDEGGYVFTEHLDYEWILRKAFSTAFKGSSYLPAKEVSIIVPPNVGLHSYLYLNNIFLEKSDSPGSSGYNNIYQWKVEDSGPDIKILLKGSITTLIVSPELAKVNNGDGIIAMTFNTPFKLPYQEQDTKGGRVLHIAGILGKQKKPLNKLLLNFLAELNQRRPRVK